ncbi:MAG: TolC family protein [Gammaproteobacteria bacterium]|nr:TolC family protein [Gammaproteobacteria bacterium]
MSPLLQRFLAIACLLPLSVSAATTPLGLPSVLAQVLDRYADLRTAELNVQRAGQELARVRSELGWQWQADLFLSRETGFLNTPGDLASGRFGVTRQLAGGGSVGLETRLERSEAGAVLSPLIPDPANTTSLSLSWRRPLLRGHDNAAYQERLRLARASEALAQADRDAARDRVAVRVIDLFHEFATVHADLNNARRARERARRFLDYVSGRAKLGIAEQHDLLQARAQQSAREADVQALTAILVGQRVALNRLREVQADDPIVPRPAAPGQSEAALGVIEKAIARSPLLAALHEQRAALEATIARIEDSQRDQLDLVSRIGPRYQHGPTSDGRIDQTDLNAFLGLEYRRAVDDSGLRAVLRQARLDGEILDNRAGVAETDLRYEVRSLIERIAQRRRAWHAYQAQVQREQRKLDDALKRHGDGRVDTSVLIQFEGELFGAELLAERQAVELSRLGYHLELLSGALWRGLPVATQ